MNRSWIAVALSFAGDFTGVAVADDEATLRKNIVNTLTTGQTDVNAVNALLGQVKPGGSFGNVVYAGPNAAAWTPMDHLGHLRTLATAYPRPGSSLHKTPPCARAWCGRTTTPESINGENLKGAHLYAGVNLIHRTGNEYDDLAPVWDWHRLPGTTTDRAGPLVPPNKAQGQRGKTRFAGGASDGSNGLTGHKQNYLNVSANKSWMMFDNAQVALGSGIEAPGAEGRVGTSVNQARLGGAATYSTAPGRSAPVSANSTLAPGGPRWVHHDSVGYFFFEPTDNATTSTKTQSSCRAARRRDRRSRNASQPCPSRRHWG